MAKDDEDDKKAEDGKEGGGKKKLILIVVPVLLVVVLAAVYFLFLMPSGTEETATGTTGSKKTAAEAAPEPSSTYLEGAVVKTDPISINLAGGHYLKVSLALQATKDAGEEVAPAKALDATITLFTMKTMEELTARESREKLREKLTERLKTLYEDKVYEVYFTEFVIV